jgi:hypothetical protein
MWLLESSSGIALTEPSDALAALQFDEQKSRAQAGLVPTFAGWILMGKTYWKIPAIRQFLVKHMGSVTKAKSTR